MPGIWMSMLVPDENAHFRPDFAGSETMIHRAGVSKRVKLSRPSDFATAAELVGVVLDDPNPTAVDRQGDKQYA
jgi:hypothetical protein